MEVDFALTLASITVYFTQQYYWKMSEQVVELCPEPSSSTG